MKAVYYEQKGPAAKVLQIGDVPDPEPGPGEVRVRVHFSGLNPSDTKARGGWGGMTSMPFPRVVPHQDGAGVIDRAGPGVSQGRIDERVWIYEAQLGRAFGTAAEYVTVPSENAVRLPDGASFEIGACLGVPAMTAHRCLFADGGIQGQTVLVAGGGGAVGHAAILLAKWAGARVVTTVSRTEQETIALAAGADFVINRKGADVAARIKECIGGALVDRVVEVAFEANLDINRAVLKPNGVISSYSSGAADSALPLQPRDETGTDNALRPGIRDAPRGALGGCEGGQCRARGRTLPAARRACMPSRSGGRGPRRPGFGRDCRQDPHRAIG